MPNKLILFTSEFPFGTGETFLETEIEFLCKGFDEVLIVSSSGSKKQTRTVPENCNVERIDLQVRFADKLMSVFQVFNPLFWQELKIIHKVYQLRASKEVVFTMLISLMRANRIKLVVSRTVKENDINDRLVFYSYWCDDTALGLALAQKKHSSIKTVSRIHGWDLYFDRSTFGYLPFRHFISSNLTKIYSISEQGINYAEKVWRVAIKDKFVLSRLGVTNHSEPKMIERDHFVITSCSGLIPLKRVNLIAEALKHITNSHILWIHIGDGPEMEKIRLLIKDLPSNVRVDLKGRMPNAEIYAFYYEVRPDLFINVSSTEGVPVSIMEAMSFGTPVIATDVGGTSEIVNEENGILVDAKILPKDLAVIITEVMAQPEKLKLKGIEARQCWKEKFNAEWNYEAFVHELIEI